MRRGVKSQKTRNSPKMSEVVPKMTDMFFQNNRYMKMGFVFND